MAEITLESLAAELKSAVEKIESLSTENVSLKEQLASVKEGLEKVATQTGTSVVIGEQEVAPKISEVPYKTKKGEYTLRFPRVDWKEKIYTSEELHEPVNAAVLGEMIAAFEKEENSFFNKLS